MINRLTAFKYLPIIECLYITSPKNPSSHCVGLLGDPFAVEPSVLTSLKNISMNRLIPIKGIFFVTAFCFLLGKAWGQDLSQEIPLNQKVRTGKLENGLTYYILRNAKPENRVELRLAVDAGSMQEDEDQLGLAHFTEHMLFNGTKNFEKNDIVDFLQSVGVEFGSDLNAYTSFDETVYMLPLPTDNPELLDKGFQILEDWAHQATFEDEEIDKERGVIIEEWRTGRGAQARMRKQTFPVILKGSRYKDRFPIGDTAIINNFEYDVIRRFYKEWYRPDLMAVIVVGDIDVDEMEAKIKSQFSGIPAPTKIREKVDNTIPDHDGTLFVAASDKEMPFTQVQIINKLPRKRIKTLEDYRSFLARRLYNDMLGSRLEELSQKADPPFIAGFSSYGGFIGETDSYSSGAFVNETGLLKGIKTLLVENKRVLEHGFQASELERAKKELFNSYEDAYKEREKTESRGLVGEYVAHFLDEEAVPGIEFEFKFVKENLDGITIDEINALPSQWISDKNRVIVINSPEKEDLEIPDESEVMAVLESVNAMEVEPYEDKVITEPLIAEIPTSGSITGEKELSEIGATELTLANGIRVILKPTDFKDDEVLLSAYSFGGVSLVEDDLYMSAEFTSPIIQQSGVRIFSSTDLTKLLAGKTVQVGAYVGDLEEGFSGSASPEDLETLFQLVYLYATAPRKDEDAFGALISQFEAIYPNLMSDPNYYFQDQVTRVLSQDHPRASTFPTMEDIAKVDLDEAYEVYKERFADMDDFVFFLVGNFEVEAIKPHIETYLASLPATDREETFKDVGIRPPAEGLTKEFKKGTENKSQVQITIPGELKDEKDRYLVRILSEALSIKLIENLREEISGVYSTRARASTFKYPYLGYSLNVSFSCSPDNVDTLIAATRIEMEKVLADGPTQEDVDKVKEQEKRDLEENLKQNRWWLNSLRSIYYNEREVGQMTEEKLMERIDGLTVEELKRVANDYINLDKQVTLILYPEEVEEIETAEAPSDITAETVIENYLTAIGGKEKLQSISTLKKQGKMSVMGMEMKTTEAWKAPNMYGSIQNTPQGDVRIILTEEKAAMSTPMGSQEMPEEAVVPLKFDKAMFPEMIYSDLEVGTELAGIEDVEEKKAYKITYTLPGGIAINKWYDVESGLCSKLSAQGQEVIFTAYTTIEGIQFPSEAKLKAQGMEMSVTVETIEINGEIDESIFSLE